MNKIITTRDQNSQGDVIHTETEASVVTYKDSNVESNLNELNDRLEVFATQEKPVKDGLWVRNPLEVIGAVGENPVVTEIKRHFDDTFKPKIEENKKSIESIVTDLNENTQDINLLKTNKANLISTPQQTLQNKSYYVSLTGNDTNEGSQSNPFKTIQRAIDVIPTVLLHNINIVLMNEGQYDTLLNVTGRMGHATINIKGNLDNPSNYKIGSILMLGCKARVKYEGVTFNSPSRDIITIEDCTRVMFNKCVIDSNNPSKVNGIISYNSTIEMSECTVNNGNAGIYSRMGSKVMSLNTNGANNNIALLADTGGVIAKNGTQPTGNVGESQNAGGVIR